MRQFFKDLWCIFFHARHHFRVSWSDASICQKCDAELIRLLIKARG